MFKKTIVYETMRCEKLTEVDISAVSILFSEHYGNYSRTSPVRPGQRIRLGPKYYEALRKNPNAYVSLARYKDRLVGHALYVLDKTTGGYLSWIIQLVVHKNFRRKSIGKKLLLSVWGFSNDRAWGLATTNPLTVKTLESSTLRKVSFSAMNKSANLIYQIGSKVSFVDRSKFSISDSHATLNTGFFVDHEPIQGLIRKYGKKWPYGKLEEGQEWVAFVFQGQDLELLSRKRLDRIFRFSEDSLIDAYSRMQMVSHPWTKGTKNEIDFIQGYVGNKQARICDFGCGIGRHLKELSERGFQNLKGVDFSQKNIDYCQLNLNLGANTFEAKDIRNYRTPQRQDAILCLYDVIGSFPTEAENRKIIRSIHRNLKPGGVTIISVMNMELTENVSKHVTDIYKNPRKLFKLKASNLMQSTGNVFNPEYFIIDSHSNIVFRKEKFVSDGELATEYIVRDKRYYLTEICEEMEKAGFQILEKRFVRAGAWDIPLKNKDLKAKEILLVARKKGPWWSSQVTATERPFQ